MALGVIQVYNLGTRSGNPGNYLLFVGATCHASARSGRSFAILNRLFAAPHQPNCQLRITDPPESCLPESPGRLHPTKDLFNSLSNHLAQNVFPVTRCPPIYGRPKFTLPVSGHMGSDFSASKHADKSGTLITLIRSHNLGINSSAGLQAELSSAPSS
jgi:hypothetical protein